MKLYLKHKTSQMMLQIRQKTGIPSNKPANENEQTENNQLFTIQLTQIPLITTSKKCSVKVEIFE